MMCKRVLVLLPNAKSILTPHNGFFTKPFSSKRRTEDKRSFTVSYLMSSCGLSREAALRASKTVNFRSAERPDSVLSLLRNHGFTQAHIYKLAKGRPDVLSADPQNTLLPKLEFFRSMGFPAADLAKVLSSNPNLLRCSLHNKLIPVCNYLTTVILLDDKKIRKTLMLSSRILGMNLEKNTIPKIEVLRELGVPASNLSLIVSDYQYVLLRNRIKFNETVKEVVKMGLNPSSVRFIHVLKLMIRITKSRLEHKMEVFRKCGWSEDDFQTAFRKKPLCVDLSKKKIMGMMDFLVNKMGWKPTAIAQVPHVLHYSLEKRIIPRCSVIQLLSLNGLVKKDLCLSTILLPVEKCFLDRFVTKYEKEVPQLLHVYQGKMDLLEL